MSASTHAGERGRAPVVRDLSGAEQLAARLDRPMGALGLVFLLVVLGQSLARDAALVAVLSAAGWALWSVFVAELLSRGAA